MYLPLVQAMNYALELLSKIEVDGLPKFKNHIAFVPCNKGVQSDSGIAGSSFKPDIAIMSIQDAYNLYQLSGAPELSKFTSQLPAKPLSDLTWKAILSAVEIKRVKGASKGPGNVLQDVDECPDEELHDSQPATGKIDAVSCGYTLTTLHSDVFYDLYFII
jgi:hypothetical protein